VNVVNSAFGSYGNSGQASTHESFSRVSLMEARSMYWWRPKPFSYGQLFEIE